MKTPHDGYQPTFLDRIGPEGASLLPLVAWSVGVAILGAFFGVLGAIREHRSTSAWGLGVGLAAGILTMVIGFITNRGSGAAFLAFIQPSGASTPAESDFSYQDALAIRGDVAGALSSYEELLQLASPRDVAVRLRAADLYADSGRDVGRAVALYKEVQRIPTAPSAAYVYATNRLVSLFLDVLAKPGNAMGELRRLIDRYPSSDVAVHARTALANLKREMRVEE
jgi:hypothetical protein